MNRQVYIKAEQIARMIVRGWSKSKIAVEMGMSYEGLLRITYDPGYLRIEELVRQQVTGKMDARLDKRAAMEDEVDDAIPEAMQVLLDGVRKKRDLRAALELLDRDPRRQFAKGTSQRPLGDSSQTPQALPQDVMTSTIAAADIAARQVARQHQQQQTSSVINPTPENYDA